MDNIKDIINDVIGKISKQTPDEIEIESVFNEVFTEKEKSHLKFVGVNDNTILINTDSSAVNYQMKMKKPAVLKGFQKKIESIKDVSFKIGSII